MTTIRFSGRTPSPQSVTLGMETDSNVETLAFVLPEIAEVQVETLQMILPDGTVDVLLIKNGAVVIPPRIMEIEGTAQAWVEILGPNTRAWHSEIIYMGIGGTPEISDRTEQQYPTALQETLSQVRAHRYVAQGSAEAAADSAAEAEAAAAYAAASSGQASFSLNSAGHLIVTRTDTSGVSHNTDAGPVSAYAIAVAAGYTGTEEQFATDMGNSATNATSAAADALRAETAADSVSVATTAEVKTYLGIA